MFLCLTVLHRGIQTASCDGMLACYWFNYTHELLMNLRSIKQIDFILLCVCTVIDHGGRHSVKTTKSTTQGEVECGDFLFDFDFYSMHA